MTASASLPTPPVLIVALDVSSLAQARGLVECLGDRAGFYKVGLQLFSSEGPRAVEWLCGEGKRVFLDLKLHDIPTTVHRAARAARTLGADLLTVHGVGGEAMLRAAVEGAGDTTGILAVTVLTSMDLDTASTALGRKLDSLQEEVARLAILARAAHCRGVVCAGAECRDVRTSHGDALRVLVPGIRLAGSARDDQTRAVTPWQAAQSGASYLVVGRTVTAAADPAEAYARVQAEIA